MRCVDCPDLADPDTGLVGDLKPRASCCADDLIERRLAGDAIEFEGFEATRAAMDERAANLSRQARRYEERKGRR